MIGLIPQVLTHRFKLPWPYARRGVLWCPTQPEHVAWKPTRGVAAASFEELNEPRKIQSRRSTHEHMDMRP